jgi:hypothetical protein
MASGFADVVTALLLFVASPGTVSSEERSFSNNLRLIETYTRSIVAQERLNSLALLSTEADAAALLETDKIVDWFACVSMC